MEGIRKRGRPWKRWTDKVEEGRKITGVKNQYTVVRDRKEWRRNVLETKVHNGLQ